MELRSPVAFFIYHREDLTRQVFARIAAARPETLLVVADGPRSDVDGDRDRVAATRAIVADVSWPCRVLREYSDVNLGLRDRFATGLAWVFENVPEAIILEDDNLPDASFFRFCQALLDRYRDDERVMSVTGENYLPREVCPPQSYYFSLNPGIWGWASWRRAWRQFDLGMNTWPEFRDSGELLRLMDSPVQAELWTAKMERAYRGLLNSWFHPWLYACWKHRGLTARSSTNLVSHVGFDDLATHFASGDRRFQPFPIGSMQGLDHPPRVERDQRLDHELFYQLFTDREYPGGVERAADAALPPGRAPNQVWVAGNVRRLEDRLVRAVTELEEKELVIQELTSALADVHLVAARRQELLHTNHVAFADLRAHLESKDDEIARQHEAIQGLQAGIRNLHHAAEDLRSAASERMLVIERLDAEIQALRTALAASQEECVARLEVIQRVDGDVQSVRDALRVSQSECAARLGVIGGLDDEVRRLRGALTTSQDECAARLDVIEGLDGEVQRLRGALAASEGECAARLDVIERLDAEVRRLRAAVAAADASETSQ